MSSNKEEDGYETPDEEREIPNVESDEEESDDEETVSDVESNEEESEEELDEEPTTPRARIIQLDKKEKKMKKYVHKIICLKKLYQLFKNHRIHVLNELGKKFAKGQKKYAVEYMKNKPTRMIKQGDLLAYCDKRRYEDTNGNKPNYKDNSRGIEKLRKDELPNCWQEKKLNGELYFIYLPELQELVTEEIINNTKHKKKGFSSDIIKLKLDLSNYQCEVTGLPVSQGHLAGDHWIPKEGGGTSEQDNCVILNKLLNEKKNKRDPVDWFCKSIMTNYLKICIRVGMDINIVKQSLIKFIQEF